MSASELPPVDIRFFGAIGQTGVFDRSNGRLIFGGKPLALLAYLLDRNERPVHRAELLELLWNGASEEAARHSLSHALWLIRKTLGVSTGSMRGKVVLSPTVKSDASQFLEAAKGENPADALWLYHGRFLDFDSYDKWGLISRWIDSEQRRYEQLFRKLYSEGIRIAEKRRDSASLRRIIDHARCVDLTPSAEDVQGGVRRWIEIEGKTSQIEYPPIRRLMSARTVEIPIALSEGAHRDPVELLREITRSLLEQPGALGTAPDHYDRLKTFSCTGSSIPVSTHLLASVVELYRAVASEQPCSITLMKAWPPVNAVEDTVEALLRNDGIDIAWSTDPRKWTEQVNQEATPLRLGKSLRTPPLEQESLVKATPYPGRMARWVLVCVLPLAFAINNWMNGPREVDTGGNRATSTAVDELLLPVSHGDSTSWLVVRIDESMDKSTVAPTYVKPIVANSEAPPPDLQHATERIGRTGWLGYRTVRSSGTMDLSLTSYNNETASDFATHPEDDIAPSYLGATDSVVFLSRRESANQSTDVWLASLDGATEKRLTRTSVNEYRPKGSPDGRQVAFLRASRQLDSMQVCVRALSDVGERCRTIGGAASESNVHWSGDSVLLIDAQALKVGRLVRIDAELQRVSEVHRDGIGYMLNSTGRYISFVSRISAPDLTIMRLSDSREIARVAEWRGHGTEAVWRAASIRSAPILDSLPTMLLLKVGDTLVLPSARLPIPSSALRYDNSNQAAARSLSSHRIVGLAPGSAEIRVRANGLELHAFNVHIRPRANEVRRVHDFNRTIGNSWTITSASGEAATWKPSSRGTKATEVRPIDVTFTSHASRLRELTGVTASFRIPYSKAGRVAVGVAIYAQNIEYASAPERNLRAGEVPICSLMLTNADVTSGSGWEYRVGTGLVGLRQKGAFVKKIALDVQIDDHGNCIGNSNGRRLLLEEANRPGHTAMVARITLRANGRPVFLDSVITTQSESIGAMPQNSPGRRLGNVEHRAKNPGAGE